ncbi:Nudix hydrolase 8 [Acorus gramineus]|uniref:Nudix hydrolase 8 n=1 Tax=Acorus gramineus TaxID=55184 RepID=A0AAV9B8X8_ACOGR|nr:Nudix hydrolase 8 [Acorus gramineus]
MEKVLFDATFKAACPLRTCQQEPLFGGRGSIRISSQSCYCRGRGSFTRFSCTAARTSKQEMDLFGRTELLLGNDSSRINGTYSSALTGESYVLYAHDDEYEGVVVDPERLPSNAISFASSIRLSLSYWKSKGRKGVWLKLPLDRSELVPIAVKEGFKYHHAEEEYVMMTYWIPNGPCLLPANASHSVGVGGFVINNKNEVLVVQEKHHSPAFAGVWKLPTGFINESEEIYAGAIREVKEETGIDTEFIEVIAFRHAHRVAFQKSDLFFICMLRPLSTVIEVDDQEIQAAKWMPLTEFVEQPLIRGDNMFKQIIDICIARLRKRYCGLSTHQVISKFDGKSSSLYYNIIDGQNCNLGDMLE